MRESMNRQYGVVILSHFPEYAKKLLSTVKLTHEHLPAIVCICDRHKEILPDCNIQDFCDDEFIYARNANRGIAHLKDKDVILCNDDLECVEPDFFHKLDSVASKYPKCGILSPLIDGGVGNVLQQYPPIQQWREISVDTVAIRGTDPASLPVCFPCVWISRRMINEIGLLDENFVQYGFDDNDYCIRARKAGYLTMITRSLHIKHGEGGNYLNRGHNWSCSFAREKDRPSNAGYFFKKHSASK
jgi:GT2 family glycosyltransferase